MEQKLSDIEAQLILLARQFLLEQNTGQAVHAISLDASLERQLGIDSLGRVEFFHRVERTFGIQFSDTTIAQTDTLHDIAQATLTAKPSKKFSRQEIGASLEKLEVDLSVVTTLQEALIQYALHNPDRPHIYLQDENGDEEIITYGTLLKKASSIANSLIQLGIKPDDAVALMLPTDNNFFPAFFGILLAGAIPAPIYPPFRADRLEEYTIREAKILNNAEVRVLITFAQAELLSKALKTYVPSLKAVVTVPNLLTNESGLPKIERTEDHSALLQYTSGSTGDPKGVLLLHKNILANIKATGKGIEFQPTDVLVSWLPLYHDMGLMSWLGSLYFGIPITILSPLTFLNRPERWLWAIHYHRATISAAPNFAYELCIKKIDEELLEGLDLSCWRLALNGAEAINPTTLSRFFQRFKKYGFKEEALFPVYGLAENTVGLALPKPGTVPRIDRIERDVFEQELRAVPTTLNKNYLEFVCEGKVIPDHEIRIVDAVGNILPERHVGNLQFRGPSSMQGYYRNQKATAVVYHNGWWDSGDLAYLADEELFIAGRRKDLIIKAGRNLYPEVFETIVSEIVGVRKGCVIAFGMMNEAAGTEKIVIVAETKLSLKEEKIKLRQTILEQITATVGIPPDEIVLVPPKKIPKTSSGKLQRSACKQAYIKGDLAKSKIIQWDISKIFIKAAGQYIFRWLDKIVRFFYTVYVGCLAVITLIPAVILMFCLPRKQAAATIKFWARNMFRFSFCPITVIHKSKYNREKPVIYTVNHASYTDSILLLAVMPTNTLFVGKKELLKVPLLASAINKLNYISLDRWDFSQNLEDMKQMQNALQQDYSILIFPEGTFTYASGLRPFKTGAFQLAAETKIPICPIAIQGTRKLFRSGAVLLTPQKLKVTFAKLITPIANDWQEIIRLRVETRKAIATYCGESALDIIVAGPEIRRPKTDDR